MRLPRPIHKDTSLDDMLLKYVEAEDFILNIGAGHVRLGNNSIGVDIKRKRGVDVLCDAHQLPFAPQSFDACVCVGVFQYFRHPHRVVEEIARVLVPRGIVIVDAPFIQHYCFDTPDLFRFSRSGLESLFSELFDVLEIRVSIAGGPALTFYCKGLSRYATNRRWLSAILQWATSVVVLPLRYLKFGLHHEVAGAHILVARKKAII